MNTSKFVNVTIPLRATNNSYHAHTIFRSKLTRKYKAQVIERLKSKWSKESGMRKLSTASIITVVCASHRETAREQYKKQNKNKSVR